MSEVAERVYKFFTVRRYALEPGRKTPRYAVLNNRSGDLLGEIAWYGSWRQFCFFPEQGTVWNNGCLADVQDAIKWAEQRRTGLDCGAEVRLSGEPTSP